MRPLQIPSRLKGLRPGSALRGRRHAAGRGRLSLRPANSSSFGLARPSLCTSLSGPMRHPWWASQPAGHYSNGEGVVGGGGPNGVGGGNPPDSDGPPPTRRSPLEYNLGRLRSFIDQHRVRRPSIFTLSTELLVTRLRALQVRFNGHGEIAEILSAVSPADKVATEADYQVVELIMSNDGQALLWYDRHAIQEDSMAADSLEELWGAMTEERDQYLEKHPFGLSMFRPGIMSGSRGWDFGHVAHSLAKYIEKMSVHEGSRHVLLLLHMGDHGKPQLHFMTDSFSVEEPPMEIRARTLMTMKVMPVEGDHTGFCLTEVFFEHMDEGEIYSDTAREFLDEYHNLLVYFSKCLQERNDAFQGIVSTMREGRSDKIAPVSPRPYRLAAELAATPAEYAVAERMARYFPHIDVYYHEKSGTWNFDSPHIRESRPGDLPRYKMPATIFSAVFGAPREAGDHELMREHLKITSLGIADYDRYVLAALGPDVYVNDQALDQEKRRWINFGDRIRVGDKFAFVFAPQSQTPTMK